MQRTSRPFLGIARSRSSAKFSPMYLSDTLGSTLPPLRSDVTTLQRKKGSGTADRSFALPTLPSTGSRIPYDTAANRSAVRPRRTSSAALATSSALQATTLPPRTDSRTQAQDLFHSAQVRALRSHLFQQGGPPAPYQRQKAQGSCIPCQLG